MTFNGQTPLPALEVAVADLTPFDTTLAALGLEVGPGWPDEFGKLMRSWVERSGFEKIPTLSLFSGAGGLDIGFHDAGFEILEMIEIDERFVRSLEANVGGPDKPLATGVPRCVDIAEYFGDALPRIEFIVGGPPCQTFSAAGRRSHGVMGVDDPRGQLFVEYLRLVEKLQPRGFLFENVYGITGAQGGEPWRLIVESFRAAGYNVFHRVLDTADYGVPQHRERLFIVGVRDGDFRFPRPTHGPDSPGQVPHFTADAAIADLKDREIVGPTSVGGRYGHLLKEVPPGLNYSFFTEKLGHPTPVFAWRSKFSDFLYKADPDVPVRTIKAQGGQYTGPFHWDNRPFTVDELKRLQTFPDDYEIVGNRMVAIHQVGNSVPPQAARMLALAVLAQVFEIRPPFELSLLNPTEELTFRQLKRQRTQQYKEKARLAIQDLDPRATEAEANGHSTEYQADLTEAFSIITSATGRFRVRETRAQSEWRYRIDTADAKSPSETFEIAIEPLDRWGLPTDRVSLEAPLDPEAFTLVWKVFDRSLHETRTKADLVQLNGYYQYEPRIRAKIRFLNAESIGPFWRAVGSIVAGHDVGVPRSLESLAFSWGVHPEDAFDICRQMRRLGYEVRNRNTNPQIPEGQILFPYAFPTLNPSSVQLKKRL